ncbi:hypothetical protein FHX42_002719 [Saccharopolyspora lacisalsi]|uniref:SEC-C motif-containing protein n=1 Tax=Halosaccharopolyspora lacisalsi TaxID=1000566 RepID=A0A839E372_9PSEU|nr:SEC-C metal-binding domain-containing protein [Halosaccharopolyspora lacisalsi]MBA8825368.1 hypothetical protein [Halosaccharopolyspora lacisalsi]
MTDGESARLRQGRDELPAENAVTETGHRLPQSPAEWAQRARETEADLAEYPDERVDVLCEAGHAWAQAGELEQAERCYRLAAAEGTEPELPDPRAYYASFLIEEYDAVRGNELLDELWRSRPTVPSTYHFVAETLEENGEYQRALNWANAGLSRCYPQPFTPGVDEVVDDQELDMLLTTRSRIREALDQPADTLDELGEQAHDAFGSALDSFERQNPVSRPTAVLYWPESEYERVPRRSSDSSADSESGARAHVDHRRETERVLRASAEGDTPLVAHGDVAEFLDFCGERERDPSTASIRNDYAGWLAEHGRGISWPPERNEVCWCGSGRKYKKCCGAPGFVEHD